MVHLPINLELANQYLLESGISHIRIVELGEDFQLQLFYAGSWWGGSDSSDPLELVQRAQAMVSASSPTLEQIPVRLEELASQVAQVMEGVQSCQQETSRYLVDASWLRDELDIMRETLKRSIALLSRIWRELISNPFPVFPLTSRRRKNSAIARAERIFQSLWLWNWQHPDDQWAVNAGLLVTTFGVIQSGAQEFLDRNAATIAAYHEHIGVRNPRSHNRGKNVAPFKDFVLQTLDSSAFVYLEEIERYRSQLEEAILALLSSLYGGKSQTLLQVAGSEHSESGDALEELRQRPLSSWQIQDLLRVLSVESEAKSQTRSESSLQTPRFSLDTILRVRLQSLAPGSPVNAIAVETLSGQTILIPLAHPAESGGLLFAEAESLQVWAQGYLNESEGEPQ